MKVTESTDSANKMFLRLWQPGLRLACSTTGGGHDIGEIKEKLVCSCQGDSSKKEIREQKVKRVRDKWGGRSQQGQKGLPPGPWCSQTFLAPCRVAPSGEKWQLSIVA